MSNANKHHAQFLKDYDKHIESILSMPSGKHSVNPDKLKDWVNSQQSQTRREVAKALSDEIIYITHKDIIHNCKTLVEEFYTQYLPQKALETPTIILFTHRRGKSGYMIALLFYYWIQQLGYPVPDMMVDELYPDLIKNPNSVFAYVDDMSYSGSQLSQILSNYAIIPSYIEKISYPNFWIGFIAITQHALDYLTTLAPFAPASISRNQLKIIVNANPNISQYNIRPEKNRIQGIKYIKIKNPFTIYASRIIPSLRNKLGDAMYVAACLFFNPDAADCILYFDHKVADSPSTFMKVLVFGPVPAVDALFIGTKFNKENENENNSYDYWSPNKNLLNIRTYDRGKDGTSHITQFKPFINGCPQFSEKDKLLWGKIPYVEFLTGNQFTNEKTNIPLNLFDSLDIRCPKSWYKTKFAGGNRTNKIISHNKFKRKTLRK